MGTGQTLLTIAAIVLLGLNVVNINKTFTQHGSVLQETEIGIFGVSLAMSVIEDAEGKAFDEKTIGALAGDPSWLSNPGPDASEDSVQKFDDFDDYNGWKDTVNIEGVDTFFRGATVVYVAEGNLDGQSFTKTWHKKLTVSVVPSIQHMDTTVNRRVEMQHIYSYWTFR